MFLIAGKCGVLILSGYNNAARGCLKSWLLFRHSRELKIKSLYINNFIFNIAKKPKETV